MIGDLIRRWPWGRADVINPLPDGQKATAHDIRACFRLILGRAPNPEEWPGHGSRIGDDLKAVVSTFLQSEEFSRRKMLGATRFSRHVLVEVNDVKVALYPDDIDVGSTLIRGVYEPNVTAVFKEQLKPGMRVVDVGANCGYFTFLARKLVGSRGAVWAIEPHVSNIRLLLTGRQANGFDDVSIVPIAAGSEMGIATLHASHTNGVTRSLVDANAVTETPLVCQMPLDAIVRDVDFIKLDIEGQEFNALQGFSSGLMGRPMIVSEFFPGMLQNATGEEYLQFLFSRGYKVGVIGRDGTIATYHGKLGPVMQAYFDSGVDHLDIFAVPT
jgi:FkbM family methyltransferase